MFQINMPKWKISSIPAVSVDREVKCSTVQLYSLDHYHLAAPLGNLAGQWQPHNTMGSFRRDSQLAQAETVGAR